MVSSMAKEHPPKISRKDRVETAGEEPAIGFEVDKQTWKDLDLFDQGRRGPVFALFNKVKTTGGGDALERMLRNPSNNRPMLEARLDTIRFFRDNDIDLQIGKEQLERVEHYLRCGIDIFPGGWLGAWWYTARNQINQTPQYFIVTNGVRTTVSLLRHLFEQVAEWKEGDSPARLVGVLRGVEELITDNRVKILLTGGSGPLGYMDLARCDHFFRRTGQAVLRRLLDLLYEWDACQAVALGARQYNLCLPQYCDSTKVEVTVRGLFHPLVANSVANDHAISEQANLCFISGANMAGKSTFLKSFGLAVYLAHVGFPVPARSFVTSIFNGLVTTVNLADSISQGYSHFYAEVRRVKDVIEKIREKRRMVVIFDELFRGTNVKDASDASLQVIDALAGIPGSLFMVSTHIVEIADLLQDNPYIDFVCFASTMEGGVPWYSYKISSGVSDERTGMAILKDEGILEMLAEIRNGHRGRRAGS
jgi:DNA mismatch repair protein MutS